VAIGVAPAQSLGTIDAKPDEVVRLYASTDFYAAGQFADFSEVTDDMVVAVLSRAARAA
jgi:predicted phosphoribosyltransferase